MILLIALGILSTVAIIGSILAVRNDGYGPIRTDWSRLPDADRGAPHISRDTARDGERVAP
ncbi:hypothetical protein [Microbacterium sp.]|uniref:hypothetical protein n=1 Tax=Microbacterium sp. TaxID=51671 RepID=UPI003C726600